MYLCSNSKAYRKLIFQIDIFLFKLRTILEVDFCYRCIYFETQKNTWSRLSKLMNLSSNSWNYLQILEADFQCWCIYFKLRSIFEEDFLNNVFLSKLRSIFEVHFISKKSKSINEVLLKYKQSTFFSVFILHLYFFLGRSLNPIRPGLLGGIKFRGGGGIQKTAPLKTLFWLSKCFEIWCE